MEFSGYVTNYTYFCSYRITQRKAQTFLASNFTPLLRNICLLLLFKSMGSFQANCTFNVHSCYLIIYYTITIKPANKKNDHTNW